MDVELAGVVQPREAVAPAIGPGHARVTSHGKHDVAAGPPQLVCELLPGGPRADHEHAALRQLIGAPVARGVQLSQPRRSGRRGRGDARYVAVAGGDHDAAGVPVATVGRDVVAVDRGPDPAHGRALVHGRRRGSRPRWAITPSRSR